MKNVIALLLIVTAVGCTVGCAATSGQLGEARSAVVDCTTARATQLIGEFTPSVGAAIAAARDGSGHVDWTAAKSSLKSFGRDTGACVLANLAAAAMGHGIASSTASLTPVDVAGANAFLGELYPGTTWKTSP